MNEIGSKTCIKFNKRQKEVDFIEIYSGTGCHSFVGKLRGQQRLSLMKSGCLVHGIIIHELLHALGLVHTQSSPDRDQFVKINYENILDGKSQNFRKYFSNVVSNFNSPYDFDSVMHYNRRTFSKNGHVTIETLEPKNMKRIGQRRYLSAGDAVLVRNMYCH